MEQKGIDLANGPTATLLPLAERSTVATGRDHRATAGKLAMYINSQLSPGVSVINDHTSLLDTLEKVGVQR